MAGGLCGEQWKRERFEACAYLVRERPRRTWNLPPDDLRVQACSNQCCDSCVVVRPVPEPRAAAAAGAGVSSELHRLTISCAFGEDRISYTTCEKCACAFMRANHLT